MNCLWFYPRFDLFGDSVSRRLLVVAFKNQISVIGGISKHLEYELKSADKNVVGRPETFQLPLPYGERPPPSRSSE